MGRCHVLWQFTCVCLNFTVPYTRHEAGIFLGMFWGRILGPSQFKHEQKIPKIVHIILHFGKISLKSKQIPKLQIHENLHRNVDESMFSFTFFCGFSRVKSLPDRSRTVMSLNCFEGLLTFVYYQKWRFFGI